MSKSKKPNPNAEPDDRVLTTSEARDFARSMEREELLELRAWCAAAVEQMTKMFAENEELLERIEQLERELENASSE